MSRSHTQCTCLSVTSTRLELCGPGADRSLSLWHAVVIVRPDVDWLTQELMLSAGVGRVAVFYGCQMYSFRVMIGELGRERVPSETDPSRSRTATPGPAPTSVFLIIDVPYTRTTSLLALGHSWAHRNGTVHNSQARTDGPTRTVYGLR